MDAKQKMIKARTGLVLDQPFFGKLSLDLTMVESEEFERAATDGESIWYNANYVDSLSLPQAKTLWAHGDGHPAMLHHVRRGNRDPRLWNMAADYAWNLVLKDAGFEPLPNWLCNDRFRGMSTERIYDVLKQAQQNGDPENLLPDGDTWNVGEVIDAPGNGQNGKATESEIRQIEQEAKIKVQQAAQLAKKRGLLSSGIDRFVQDLCESKIPWREVLNRWLSEITKNDYTWSRPNKRYMPQGLYLPSLRNVELGQIALLVDTSGSIDENQLNETASEIQEILGTFNTDLQVVYVDSKVCGHEVISANDYPVKLHAKGGGGTSFVPGFDWIDQQGIELAGAVYFTDGYCDAFPSEPDYPVIWALTREIDDWNPPFGETIVIND